MVKPLVPGEPLNLARALYADVLTVACFIDEKVRAPVDARAGALFYGEVFRGQLLRAIAWLRSICKLDHPADFQAVTAGTRAIFEGAVDVTLMHFDATANGPKKMIAWEDSAKFKHAQTVSEYLATARRQPSEAEQYLLTYVSREKDRIEGLRLQYWPNDGGRHPRNRWTGRDLAQDAKEADKYISEGFEEFYRLRYPELCWNVHGSGLTGIANISTEAFPCIGGLAAAEAARFALVGAKVVAKHLDCWDDESFRQLPAPMTEARVPAQAVR